MLKEKASTARVVMPEPTLLAKANVVNEVNKMTTCESIICDMNNLYDAYLMTIKGSKWKETTQKFALDYLKLLVRLIHNLENRSYKISEEGEFTLNERGKVRPITTLCPTDRVVRHVLCDHVLLPEIEKHIIYDNGASIKGRGITHSRKRFEVHLHKFYMEYGTNEGWILFGDFSKFYDNVRHEIAKEQFLKLFNYDEYLDWLLTIIFKNFEVDVSFLTDKEIENLTNGIFSMLSYRDIPSKFKTKTKFMKKSCNIGDQLSQVIGIYYPNEIDTLIKHVFAFKYYGRYMDDFYIFSKRKEELIDVLEEIQKTAFSLGIHLNMKKTRIVKMNTKYKYLQTKYTLSDTGSITKRINPKRLTAMRRRLKKLYFKVKKNETDYKYVEEMFRSWMSNHYKNMSRVQRDNLLKLFESLFDVKIVLRKQSGKWKMIFEGGDENAFVKN